jgi:opacity protein-like surface antigen
MTHMRRASAAVVVLLLVLASAAVAQELPAPVSGDTPVAGLVDQFGGITVWSAPAAGGYALMARTASGVVRLPIGPRAVPFDVDLGPDGSGGVVGVYSRCSIEPMGSRAALDRGIFAVPGPAYTTGKGCDLYRFDFASGREAKIASASTATGSEMLPSYWKGSLAFVRVYPGRKGRSGVYPYLYLRTAAGKTRQLTGGPRGVSGLPGPTSLDLNDRTVGFVWNSTTNRGTQGRSEVHVDTLERRSRRVAHTSLDVVNGSYATFLSPTLSSGTIYYGYQRVRGLMSSARPALSASSRVFSRRLRTGRVLSAAAPPFLTGFGIDGTTTAYGVSIDGEQYFIPRGSVLVGGLPDWRP